MELSGGAIWSYIHRVGAGRTKEGAGPTLFVSALGCS